MGIFSFIDRRWQSFLGFEPIDDKDIFNYINNNTNVSFHYKNNEIISKGDEYDDVRSLKMLVYETSTVNGTKQVNLQQTDPLFNEKWAKNRRETKKQSSKTSSASSVISGSSSISEDWRENSIIFSKDYYKNNDLIIIDHNDDISENSIGEYNKNPKLVGRKNLPEETTSQKTLILHF